MDTSAARPSWCSLPPEIRVLVLQCLIPRYGQPKTTTRRRFGKAPCLATVSREWQCFFEKEAFRLMAIKSSDLSEFAKVVREKNAIRLDYIKHLRLNVQLAEYTCRVCDKPESARNIAQDNRDFTYAIAVLLDSLSSWKGIRGGLTLEIIAYSPSDQEHHRVGLELSDDFPFLFEEDLGKSPDYSEYCRQKREENRRRSQGIRPHPTDTQHGMAQRLRGSPLELQPWLGDKPQSYGKCIRNLQDVPIVKGLLLRQEFLRGIALKSLAKLCRESFVALESFRLERYVGLTREAEQGFYKELRTDLMPALPTSVERFAFMQMRRQDSFRDQPFSTVIKPLEWELGVSCHRFAEFVPPYNINANRFLKRIVKHGRREGSKLQHLSIHSNALYPSANPHRVMESLALAGRAAQFLPRLRTLEIWNSDHKFGYLFRYTQDDFEAKITWRWAKTEFALVPSVIDEWVKVASTRALAVETFPFTEEDGNEDGLGFGNAAIIRHLALRRLAFDPISEARHRAWAARRKRRR
ncbi:hypothetical protein BKA56DRAFT_713874 [Ilyonectria sp. MPI-CAGE-AT-0026]|nr:hypothetical protein BKA56DRAFT_713874 [Ilyonectria sp. MPI-CAGE-AT-0026]